MRITPRSTARFWARVEKAAADGCWNWTGPERGVGYGGLYVGSEATYAHRFSYELHHGPIPEGAEIDHLCRNRRCCNPDHLEAVSHRENQVRGETLAARNVRKTHCPKGHPLAGRHLYVHPGSGSRRCRTCNTEARARYLARLRGAEVVA